MSWKKWKAGLLVSFLSGILTGALALTFNLSMRDMVILLLVNAAKDPLLYLTNHPVDKIEDDPGPPR